MRPPPLGPLGTLIRRLGRPNSLTFFCITKLRQIFFWSFNSKENSHKSHVALALILHLNCFVYVHLCVRINRLTSYVLSFSTATSRPKICILNLISELFVFFCWFGSIIKSNLYENWICRIWTLNEFLMKILVEEGVSPW